ncbi:MAG: hypothetical protein R2774_13045 [Saprospiraceae bacterium]
MLQNNNTPNFAAEINTMLTTMYKEKMVSHLKSHPYLFEPLLDLALKNEPWYSWRAAWLIWSCMDKNDSRIGEKITEIIDIIPNRPTNHQRELLKVLQNMQMDKAEIGHLTTICLGIWEDISSQASARYNAIKLLVKISKSYPELMETLTIVVDEIYLESLSDGVKKSILHLMNKEKC